MKRRGVDENTSDHGIGGFASACFVRAEGGEAPVVMVLQKSQLDVILRIDELLCVKCIQIEAEGLLVGHLVLKACAELLVNVVLVLCVKDIIHLAVCPDGKAFLSGGGDEGPVDCLSEPEAGGIHNGDLRLGIGPEGRRDQGRHITSESVHYFRPEAQGLCLIIPKVPVAVIKVIDISPVPEAVSERSVSFSPVELRML